ncbi:MAG TPA: iron chelate uptake ABC transporter family permease subunit [Gaiella sp.]
MSATPVAVPGSAVVDRRHSATTVIVVAFGIGLLVSFATLGLGAVRVPQPDATKALFGFGTIDEVRTVRDFELPRILIAWLAGGSLAIAGAVIQGVIRNPLASPDIIGVTKGAGLAVVVVLLAYPSAAVSYLPAAAFVGGVVAMAIVYLLAYRKGTTPVRLALVGIAVAATFEAIIRYVMIDKQQAVGTALVWLTGSLAHVDMTTVWEFLPWVLVLVPLCFAYSLKLDLLGLGDDLASGLGVSVERTRRTALLIAVLLASATVAVMGTIAFIGLIGPHIARRLVGSRHAVLLPASAGIGAVLVLVADAIGRGAHPPVEIPAGMITALIGAPYFVYLLSRSL